jgi:hypothetical protein
MTRLTKRAALDRLQSPDRVVMVTHCTQGPAFTIEPDGFALSARTGRDLLPDLFESDCVAVQSGRQSVLLVGNEDGLFPGMSQTFRGWRGQ